MIYKISILNTKKVTQPANRQAGYLGSFKGLVQGLVLGFGSKG
jgi:hypothetical protein